MSVLFKNNKDRSKDIYVYDHQKNKNSPVTISNTTTNFIHKKRIICLYLTEKKKSKY